MLKGIQFGLGRLCTGGGVDRLDRRRQRLAILPAGVIQAVANQMHDTGLQRRGGVDHAERLPHAFQAVGNRDQYVVAAAGLQVVEHLHPELRPFGVLDPNSQNVPAAVVQHPQGQIHGFATNHGDFADLHAQSIKEHHRIHGLQRARLPRRHLGHDRVSDAADEVRGNVYRIHLGQKALYLAHRHAARVHRDDLVVKAGKTALVLANELWLERAFTIPWHVDAQRGVAGQNGLATVAVAVVGDFRGLGGPGRVAQMVTHLGTQGALNERLFKTSHDVFNGARRHWPGDKLIK